MCNQDTRQSYVDITNSQTYPQVVCLEPMRTAYRDRYVLSSNLTRKFKTAFFREIFQDCGYGEHIAYPNFGDCLKGEVTYFLCWREVENTETAPMSIYAAHTVQYLRLLDGIQTISLGDGCAAQAFRYRASLARQRDVTQWLFRARRLLNPRYSVTIMRALLRQKSLTSTRIEAYTLSQANYSIA